jgi:dihydrofolate synthase/folylpolyglutamate synthase
VSSRDYLFSLEQIGIKLGLDQIRALLGELGRPDHAFPSLIIAGTNGKGSVTAMVERGLRAAGYRTGRYTSPHLPEHRRALRDRRPDDLDR